MDAVGGDDHPAARDLVAHQFGLELFAARDEFHFGRDDAGAGLFELGHRADLDTKETLTRNHIRSSYRLAGGCQFGWSMANCSSTGFRPEFAAEICCDYTPAMSDPLHTTTPVGLSQRAK